MDVMAALLTRLEESPTAIREKRGICPQLGNVRTLRRWEGPGWRACGCMRGRQEKKVVTVDMIVSVCGLGELAESLWKTEKDGCLVAV